MNQSVDALMISILLDDNDDTSSHQINQYMTHIKYKIVH